MRARCAKHVQKLAFYAAGWDCDQHSSQLLFFIYIYLPCSGGNSPTSSGNWDQSVGSMSPRLPGAQDKISHPSQVGRNWKHEITFSVFGFTVVSAITSKREGWKWGERKKEKKKKNERKKTNGQVVLRTLFPHIRSQPNFGTNSGERSPPQSSAPGWCQTLTQSAECQFIHRHVWVKQKTKKQKQCKPP